MKNTQLTLIEIVIRSFYIALSTRISIQQLASYYRNYPILFLTIESTICWLFSKLIR